VPTDLSELEFDEQINKLTKEISVKPSKVSEGPFK
jgi:hypothetical protein